MLKVGQIVTIDEIWAAGWMIETLDGKTKDMSFVSDDETLGVFFIGGSDTAVIYEHE